MPTVQILLGNGLGKDTTSCFLVLIWILISAAPTSSQQYYYYNGYYYPQQQQFFQFSDQSWQYQQQMQFQNQFQPQPQPQFIPAQPVIYQQLPAPAPQAQQQQPQMFQQQQQQQLTTARFEPPQPPPAASQEKVAATPPPKNKPSETRLEFDLPPPPPSRFLPDEKDKVKIAQLLAQRRNRRPKRPNPNSNKTAVQQQLQAQHNALEQQQQRERTTQVISTTTIPPPMVEQPREPPAPPAVQEAQPAVPQVSHLSPQKSNEPNKVFLSCCKHKRVDKKCESRCNFDNLSKKVLTQMFLGTDTCPQSYGLDLFSCAAQDSDHTPCCMGKKVERTSAGNKCLAFCKMTPDSHFQADASYLPCWAVLNNVKACFKEAILNDNLS